MPFFSLLTAKSVLLSAAAVASAFGLDRTRNRFDDGAGDWSPDVTSLRRLAETTVFLLTVGAASKSVLSSIFFSGLLVVGLRRRGFGAVDCNIDQMSTNETRFHQKQH